MNTAEEVPEARALLEPLKLDAAFGMADPESLRRSRGKDPSTGAIFIDVFGKEERPGSKKNVAMLYVVGPKGSKKGRPVQEGGPCVLGE